MKVEKAVIVAAGLGTRFLPVTKSVPKELLPLGGKPVIHHAVEEAVACGIRSIVIVTSQGKEAIEKYFDVDVGLELVLKEKNKTAMLEEVRRLSCMADICYVHQQEQLGLGHAVLTAEIAVGQEPFVLILPDDLFAQKEKVLKEMLGIFEEKQCSVIASKRVEREELSRYGVVKTADASENICRVVDVVEKPALGEALSDLAIMGRYVFTPEIFEALRGTAKGVGGEIQLTDALKRLLGKQSVYGYEITGEYYDAGTIPGWIRAVVAFTLKDPDLGGEFREYLRQLLG